MISSSPSAAEAWQQLINSIQCVGAEKALKNTGLKGSFLTNQESYTGNKWNRVSSDGLAVWGKISPPG